MHTINATRIRTSLRSHFTTEKIFLNDMDDKRSHLKKYNVAELRDHVRADIGGLSGYSKMKRRDPVHKITMSMAKIEVSRSPHEPEH